MEDGGRNIGGWTMEDYRWMEEGGQSAMEVSVDGWKMEERLLVDGWRNDYRRMQVSVDGWKMEEGLLVDGWRNDYRRMEEGGLSVDGWRMEEGLSVDRGWRNSITYWDLRIVFATVESRRYRPAN